MAVVTASAAKAADTIITIPGAGGPCRVEGVHPTTGAKQVWLLPPKKVGQLLAGIEDEEGERPQDWLDLLGSHGIAVQYDKLLTRLIMTFPQRVKTVRIDGSRHLHNDENPIANVEMGVPPCVWILAFTTATGRLQAANLLVTPQKVTSVRDTVPALAFPYCNVHDPNGAVCWGNVSTASLRPEDPVAVDNLFFATGFNDHITRLPQFQKPAEGAGVAGAFGNFRDWVLWMRRHPGVVAPPVMGRLTFNGILGRVVRGRDE